MSGKSQTIVDFTVSRLSKILPTNENSKSIVDIFPIIRDGRGQIWRIGSVPIFPRRIPDFCDGRRSFPTNENSNLYRRGRLRWILLLTNPLNCWAPVSLSCICEQISIFGALSIFAAKFNTGRIWDRLLAIMWYYRQNMGRLAKSKIPDRLGFSWRMKTRLQARLPVAVRDMSQRIPPLFHCGLIFIVK